MARAITRVAVRKLTTVCQLGPLSSINTPMPKLNTNATEGTAWRFSRPKLPGSRPQRPIIQLTRAEAPM